MNRPYTIRRLFPLFFSKNCQFQKGCYSIEMSSSQAPSPSNIYPDFQYRSLYEFPPNFHHPKWFPQHMHIQFKKMEGKLRSVDLIVEVHDARIALTGRNPEFYSRLYAIRPHILVMNKMDLIAERHRPHIENYYRLRGVEHILWTDCKTRGKKAIRDLTEVMINILRKEHRFNRTVKTEYQVMVVGVPNVGKSSLVNSLRNVNIRRHAGAVNEGRRPGVTTRVQTRVRIADDPLIYMLDTPGILYPNTRNMEDVMKVALCDLMLDTLTRVDFVTDYLLYWLNKNMKFSYVEHFGLANGPTNDMEALLKEICKNQGLVRIMNYANAKVERFDRDLAMSKLLKLYRNHTLDDHFLDGDILYKV